LLLERFDAGRCKSAVDSGAGWEPGNVRLLSSQPPTSMLDVGWVINRIVELHTRGPCPTCVGENWVIYRATEVMRWQAMVLAAAP
jgi:hypothetical protein